MKVDHGSIVCPRVLTVSDEADAFRLVAASMGKSPKVIALMDQVHGKKVVDIKVLPTSGIFLAGEGDALITAMPEVTIVARTADCVPLIVFDEIKGVVAVVHAGYQGILLGVIESTFRSLKDLYAVDAADVRVHFGPAICPNHYDVTVANDGRIEKFQALFGDHSSVIVRSRGKTALDLPLACRLLCVKQGVLAKNIGAAGPCTYEEDRWPSHRREGEARTRNIWTFACLSNK